MDILGEYIHCCVHFISHIMCDINDANYCECDDDMCE